MKSPKKNVNNNSKIARKNTCNLQEHSQGPELRIVVSGSSIKFSVWMVPQRQKLKDHEFSMYFSEMVPQACLRCLRLFSCLDKGCLDKCHSDSWNLFKMVPATYFESLVKIGPVTAKILAIWTIVAQT